MDEIKTHHILVADDDQGILDLLKEILEYEGFKVSTALNGRDALRAARKNPVDIAFLDLKMPQMDGLDTLKAIKEIDPTVEVVIMTAYPSADTLRDIIENGASDYLIKPVERMEILRSLRLASLRRRLLVENVRMKRDINERLRSLEEAFQAQLNQFRKTQIKYRTILDNINDSIIVVQGNNIKFANLKTLDELGYSREEILKVPLSQCIHHEDRERILNSYRASVYGKEPPSTLIIRVLRKDQSWFWAEASQMTIEWEDRAAVLIVLRDLSERISAQRAFKEVKERHDALYNRSILCVYVHDLEGRFLDANEAACRLFGYSKDEIDSVTLSMLLDKRGLQKAKKAIEGLLNKTAEKKFVKYRVKTKQGKRIWIEVEGTLLYKEGRPFAIQGIARDITDRIEALKELKQSEQRYRTIIENIKDGFLVFDLDSSELLYYNRHLLEVLGLARSQMKNLSFWDLIDPKDHETLRSHLRMMTHSGHTGTVHNISMIRAEREPFLAEISISPIKYMTHRAAQVIIRDVTEREYLREQLLRTKKMEAVGTLAGGIAHEFNNILAAIQGYAQLSQYELGPGHPTNEYQQKIMESCSRASDLVRKLLLYTRLGSWEKMPVELGQLLSSCMDDLRENLPSRIKIEGGIQEDAIYVLGEPSLLRLVIMNLASNAADAMPNGGRISIMGRIRQFDDALCKTHPWATKGAYAEIEVHDTGEGMDPHVMEHVFEPFFTTKEPGKGVGLGLFLAYAIVQNHGGHIEVESRPGKGSLFRLFLPTFKGPMEGEWVSQEQEAHFKEKPSGRILVVDDEEEFRRIAREVLTREGYEVELTSNGREAVDLFHERLLDGQPFDLVLLDLRMPVMDGEQCLERLLEMDPGAKVIIATGYGDEQIPTEGVKNRIRRILHKPFDLSVMVEEVGRILNSD
jgi:PAS domain S-box-containing protein